MLTVEQRLAEGGLAGREEERIASLSLDERVEAHHQSQAEL